MPSLCANYDELRIPFNNFSSRLSCESVSGDNQASEKMLFSRILRKLGPVTPVGIFATFTRGFGVESHHHAEFAACNYNM